MIQLKTSLNKVEITYIEKADFPLSIDGVHLSDSDIKELYEFLKTQVYKDEIIHSVSSSLDDCWNSEEDDHWDEYKSMTNES